MGNLETLAAHLIKSSISRSVKLKNFFIRERFYEWKKKQKDKKCYMKNKLNKLKRRIMWFFFYFD